MTDVSQVDEVYSVPCVAGYHSNITASCNESAVWIIHGGCEVVTCGNPPSTPYTIHNGTAPFVWNTALSYTLVGWFHSIGRVLMKPSFSVVWRGGRRELWI